MVKLISFLMQHRNHSIAPKYREDIDITYYPSNEHFDKFAEAAINNVKLNKVCTLKEFAIALKEQNQEILSAVSEAGKKIDKERGPEPCGGTVTTIILKFDNDIQFKVSNFRNHYAYGREFAELKRASVEHGTRSVFSHADMFELRRPEPIERPRISKLTELDNPPGGSARIIPPPVPRSGLLQLTSITIQHRTELSSEYRDNIGIHYESGDIDFDELAAATVKSCKVNDNFLLKDYVQALFMGNVDKLTEIVSAGQEISIARGPLPKDKGCTTTVLKFNNGVKVWASSFHHVYLSGENYDKLCEATVENGIDLSKLP